MKKLVLILGLFLGLSANAQADDNINKQEFVNPIFNKPLFAYGRTSWNTLLTPNSVTVSPNNFSSPDAYIEQYPCELLENKHDHVKFNCTICYGYLSKLEAKDCYHDIIIYQITTDGKIKETTFNPNRPEFQSIEYLITKP